MAINCNERRILEKMPLHVSGKNCLVGQGCVIWLWTWAASLNGPVKVGYLPHKDRGTAVGAVIASQVCARDMGC